MICPIQQSLNSHLSKLDAQDEKELAIELLAEKLSSAASLSISEVLRASAYDFDYKIVNNSTNGSYEFNEMLYKVAEKLINSLGN
jgi:hypothetical protein